MSNNFEPPIVSHAGPLSRLIFNRGQAELTPANGQFGPLIITFEHGRGNGFYDRRFRWVRVTQGRNPRLTQVRQSDWTDADIEKVVYEVLNTVPSFGRFNSVRYNNSAIIPSLIIN